MSNNVIKPTEGTVIQINVGALLRPGQPLDFWVAAEYQPSIDKWLTHIGNPDKFYLLTLEQITSILNQAQELNCPTALIVPKHAFTDPLPETE